MALWRVIWGCTSIFVLVERRRFRTAAFPLADKQCVVFPWCLSCRGIWPAEVHPILWVYVSSYVSEMTYFVSSGSYPKLKLCSFLIHNCRCFINHQFVFYLLMSFIDTISIFCWFFLCVTFSVGLFSEPAVFQSEIVEQSGLVLAYWSFKCFFPVFVICVFS